MAYNITALPFETFSFCLDRIDFNANVSTVSVEILRGAISIFKNTLHSANNTFTIYDVKTFIEDDMKKNDLNYATYQIVTVQGTQSPCYSINVLYMPYDIENNDISNFLSHHFLYIKDYAFLTTGSPILLKGRGLTVGGKVSIDISFYIYGDTTIRTYNTSANVTVSSQLISYSYENLQNLIPINIGGMPVLSKKEFVLSSVKLSHGDRSFSFYYVDLKEDLMISYRNSFNLSCYLPLKCKVTKKTDTEQSEANVDSLILFYDRRTAQQYEVEVTPYNDDHADCINEMLASHDIKVLVESTYQKVVITDYTSEISNEPGKEHSIKFSFKFENTIPKLSL